MKKIRNLLFLVVFLVCAITLIPKVEAITPEIQSITVKQGDTVLTKEGNTYIANGYENLYFSYSVPGNNYGNYYIVVYDNEVGFDNSVASGYYYPNFVSEIWLSLPNMENANKTYTIRLCDEWDCETIYDTETVNINFTKVGTFNDDKIYYTKVMQGGVESINDDYVGGFVLNNRQDVIFSIIAENLDATATYEIECANNSMKYTGAELMAGVDYTCIVSNYNYDSFGISYTIARSTWNIGWFHPVAEYIYYPSLYLNEDSNIKAFDATLKYTNYNKEISRVDDDYWGEKYHYLTLSKYFNAIDTMTYYVKGTDFENKNYNVKLSVVKGNEVIHTQNLTVSGNNLNSGYNAVFNFNPGTVSNVRYLMRVTIDDVTAETDIEYIYSDKEISVRKVVQGYEETELAINNGYYVANGYEYLYLYFDVSNYQSGDELYVGLANGTQTYSPNNSVSLSLDQFTQADETFTVKLCADMECETVYTFDEVNIRWAPYEQVMSQRIWFYNVRQGGHSISMEDDGSFIINDMQMVKAMVKGDNLVADATYSLSLDGNPVEVLGSELANGVEITADPKNNGYMSPNFKIGDYYLKEMYYDGENYHQQGYDGNNYVYFNFDTDETYDLEYEATLKYKNYSSTPVTKIETEWGDEYYVISTQYHNSSNPLMYYLKGTGYKNINYNVNVKVILNYDTVYYNHDFTVSGNNLNSGTNLQITDLVLQMPTDIDAIMNGDFGMPMYKFMVSVDEVVDEKSARYNGIGKNVGIGSEIFYENGKKNLSVFRGFGNSGMYDANKDVFIKYSKIYINFLGYDFVDEDEYDYVLEYGYYNENPGNNENSLAFPNSVKTGKVTGKVLNEVGVFFELDNNKNYTHPSYRFYVKKGSEIVAFTAPVIYTTENATLGSVVLTSQNRDMYLKTGDYSYIATKNMPFSINVSGIGFDDDKEYSFSYCYVAMYSIYHYGDEVCNVISLNGKELNDGTANIPFDEEITDEIGYNFYLYGGGDSDGYFGQGMFDVSFVDNSSLLPTINKYLIDDASEIIKGIKKQTTVQEFMSNITVAEGNSIKVFDKTGTTEVTGQLGTGMMSRVLDEYDRNVLNIGIAIKGDTTGDGNISITDLVKVKGHLLETETLEDVYAVAGDVDGTAGISITDLVQMCEDVTEIKELD